MRRVALACLAACAHPPPAAAPVATPAPGIAIALYADRGDHGIAVIDDRRWVEVAGDRLVLDDLDTGVALPSLVLEALSGPGSLAIGACVRDRAKPGAAPEQASGLGDNPVPPPPPPPPPPKEFGSRPRTIVIDTDTVTVIPTELPLASTVHCAVTGAPGRYLLRVLYSSTTLAYYAEHEITVATADRAHLESHLTITTPAWHGRGNETSAQITAYDGLPGGDTAPIELAHGRVLLDGSVGVLALPARDVPARMRRVLTASEDIAVGSDAPAVWIEQRRSGVADESDALVWVWLELPGLHLAPGLVHVTVNVPGEDSADVVVSAENRAHGDDADATLRLPLWTDDELRASIQRSFGGSSRNELVERFGATVQDNGPTPREVYVEEHLRAAGKRSVSAAFPGKPGLVGNTLRARIVVAPAKAERVGFVVKYVF